MNTERSPKARLTTACALVAATALLGILAGCPSSDSTAPGSSTQAAKFPAPMVSSTYDSGLMLTIGMPRGDITKPDGNPIALSTVPEDAVDRKSVV